MFLYFTVDYKEDYDSDKFQEYFSDSVDEESTGEMIIPPGITSSWTRNSLEGETKKHQKNQTFVCFLF
jgi:hypothetical protein